MGRCTPRRRGNERSGLALAAYLPSACPTRFELSSDPMPAWASLTRQRESECTASVTTTTPGGTRTASRSHYSFQGPRRSRCRRWDSRGAHCRKPRQTAGPVSGQRTEQRSPKVSTGFRWSTPKSYAPWASLRAVRYSCTPHHPISQCFVAAWLIRDLRELRPRSAMSARMSRARRTDASSRSERLAPRSAVRRPMHLMHPFCARHALNSA